MPGFGLGRSKRPGQGWRRGYHEVAGPLGGMAPFYAWAGTALLNDFAPRVDQPGGWLRAAHLAPARRWTAHWRARVGLPASDNHL